jgi:putative hydrolase of the HAD superfamily
MVLVFDLDDTLYDELEFVKSGFRAVTNFLNVHWSVPRELGYSLMLERLQNGRDHIFDDVLSRLELFSIKRVLQCVSVYRGHTPDIRLYTDADDCLQRFRDLPVYIVTDGNRLVQSNKLKALGLLEKAKFCFLTHCYGLRNSKPSPYCFLKICCREKVRPQDVAYIGDNPHKDFVGIKPLGFKTIRILRGQHKDTVKPEEFDADYRLDSLSMLDYGFLQRVFEV